MCSRRSLRVRAGVCPDLTVTVAIVLKRIMRVALSRERYDEAHGEDARLVNAGRCPPPASPCQPRVPSRQGYHGAFAGPSWWKGTRYRPNQTPDPCSISVLYKSGPSHAAGLVSRTADGQGRVSWTWKVGTRTTPGFLPIVIACGQTDITRVRTSFEVT